MKFAVSEILFFKLSSRTLNNDTEGFFFFIESLNLLNIFSIKFIVSLHNPVLDLYAFFKTWLKNAIKCG